MNVNCCHQTGDGDFRQRIEYLETVDDGWRAVLADIDSLLKTFGSLTAQAASGELRALLDCGRKAQQLRRHELDGDFDANLALLQQGAGLEETQPITSQLADVDWSHMFRAAWANSRSGNATLGGPSAECHLSKSLPSGDSLLANLQSKLMLNQPGRLGWSAADDTAPWPSGPPSATSSAARRHSVWGAPGERMAPRHAGWPLRQPHRVTSSSVDSRSERYFCDDETNNSLANSHDDTSPTNDLDGAGDWDYDVMYNKVVHRPKHPVKLPHRLWAGRRASSPPGTGLMGDVAERRPSHHDVAHMPPRRLLLGEAQQTLCPAAQALVERGNINQTGEMALDTKNARYLVIKSFTEESIFSSIKYSVWCSTFRGNQRLDKVYRSTAPSAVYLFFSVNNTGNFCGVAQMTSPVDFERYAGCWTTPRWKGAFAVKWLYVKDVPFRDFRDIVLPDDGKPVCKSRDTQEVLPPHQGVRMLRVFHERRVFSSVFNDFEFYEEKAQRYIHPEPSAAPIRAGGDLDFTDD